MNTSQKLLAIVRDYPNYQAPPTGNAPATNVDLALKVLVNIIDFAMVAFWILAAGFGLYGAYLYLFSRGNKESLARARDMMIYTVVAIAVAIVAYGIPSIVNDFIFTR